MTKIGYLIPALRALLALALVLLLGEVVFRGFLVPLLGLRLTDTPDFRQWPGMLYLGFLFPVTMTALALVLHRFVDRRWWGEIGLGMDRGARRVSVIGALLMIAGFAAFIGTTQLTGTLQWRVASSVSWRLLLTVTITYLGTGLWEEFFFRGYLYRTLRDYGKPAAYVVSIALFSLIHFTEEPLVLPRVLNLLVVSNQFRISPLIVQGPAGGPLRLFSTVLHLVLIVLVWRSTAGKAGAEGTAG